MQKATGLYRDVERRVMVDYGTRQIRIPRITYVTSGYQPPYDQLPTKEQYEAAAQRKK